ncbi:MAG: hypothetical protein O3A21_04880 [Proteobacteria bacterium]|nr:hypothetical protein [Pseudomonadota bacterium]
MMLRASATSQTDDFNLNTITEGAAAGTSGVTSGAALLAFAEAALSNDAAAVAETGTRIVSELGWAGLADAAAVAAAFNAIDRVADATGIPLDRSMDDNSVELRAELGLDTLATGR